MKQLIIVTGMSGAGKSTAIEVLEDLGIYCIDNLPPFLVPKLLEMMDSNESSFDRVALGINYRGTELFDHMVREIEVIRNQTNISLRVLYLDASDDRLVARFKESRRAHPFDSTITLAEAIRKERENLIELKAHATEIIDTTDLKPKELRDIIIEKFSRNNENVFNVNVKSFGFKHGNPIDADLMFDVRFLPNPHYIEVLRPLTGLDKRVSDYVMSFDESHQFYEKLLDLLKYIIPKYQLEGKTQLVIGIGCTGGQHRSVTLAEKLKEDLRDEFEFTIKTTHRDAEIEGRIL